MARQQMRIQHLGKVIDCLFYRCVFQYKKPVYIDMLSINDRFIT